MSNINFLVDQIGIDKDTLNISIQDKVFESCLNKSKAELTQWLYSVLHVKNPNIFENNAVASSFGDLNVKITETISDPGIILPLKWEVEEDRKIAVITGVKVDVTDYIVDNKVLLPCFRPNITPGFFMFNHNSNITRWGGLVKRFYIGANNPNYAIDLWAKGINVFIDKGIDFQAKVLSDSKSYPRTDAVVFYVPEEYEDIVEKVLISLISESNDNIVCSPLCEEIIYNLSKADEPIQLEHHQQSFGENRCSIIADSIHDSIIKGLNFGVILRQRMLSSKVNPDNLSQNLMIS
ncbi:T3SS effector HopA1 family protein [Streptococcus dentapri]|uniref:T3SS effector HopA1 family protein n=1 Tax=Streptococcus dentapri TaxID=573564 RepID=A0ABV8CYJ6_9STRE